jgi:hypothetical protein
MTRLDTEDLDTQGGNRRAASARGPSRLPALAEGAGYAGVLPFAAGLLALVLLPSAAGRELAQRALIAYGAVILAFVGGVHFGLALVGRLRFSVVRAAGAVVPSVVGTVAVVLGGSRGLGLLVVGFGLFWLYEHRLCAAELPPGYLGLRRNLSLAVCVLLAIAMIATDSAGLA